MTDLDNSREWASQAYEILKKTTRGKKRRGKKRREKKRRGKKRRFF